MVVAMLSSVLAQSVATASDDIYRNAEIGLTYKIPDHLVRMADNELPKSSGRDHIILALWDEPRRTPVPRVVFLYDSKVQSSALTPDDIGLKYLKSLRPQDGYKMSEPQRVAVGSNTMWRMDYWRPDVSGQSNNSAITYVFRNRTVLFIQMNADTQDRLNSLVDSLKTLVIEQR